MNPADPYGAGDDDFDELPTLPIPRPGEWSPMASASQPAEPRLAPPALGGGLGGGASFTAAGDTDAAVAPDVTADADQALAHVEREQVDAERFTWELAARLTSGMLANPARGGSSVKDAMGLFDQLLQEMHSYTRIASEFDLLGHEAARRTAHEAYFQQRAASAAQGPEHPVPGAAPTASASPTSGHAPAPLASSLKPEPTQPRPMGDYRPIPPGARAPYAPGSMAGTPPTDRQNGDAGEQAA